MRGIGRERRAGDGFHRPVIALKAANATGFAPQRLEVVIAIAVGFNRFAMDFQVNGLNALSPLVLNRKIPITDNGIDRTRIGSELIFSLLDNFFNGILV